MSSRTVCTICNVRCDSEQQLATHENGKKHRSKCLSVFKADPSQTFLGIKISAPKQTTPTKSLFDLSDLSSVDCDAGLDHGTATDSTKNVTKRCDICNLLLNSNDQYIQHIKGRKHLKKAKETATSDSNAGSATDTTDSLNECLSLLSTNALHTTTKTSPTDTFDHSKRRIVRSCRKYLSEIWPGATYSQDESYTLLTASEAEADCILRLNGGKESWFRVGIHLVTALLEANRLNHLGMGICSSIGSIDGTTDRTENPLPYAVWISPTVSQGPDPVLFSYFRFSAHFDTNSANESLRVVRTSIMPEMDTSFDLLLTDPDYFVNYFAARIFVTTVCCFIIQDAEAICQHEKFLQVMSDYLRHYDDPSTRARVICLSTDRVQLTSCFRKFREIYHTSDRTEP